MLMDTAIIVAGFSTAVALGGSFASWRASTKANQVESRKVEQTEYDQGQTRLQNIIKEQAQHIDWLNGRVESLQRQIDKRDRQIIELQEIVRSR